MIYVAISLIIIVILSIYVLYRIGKKVRSTDDELKVLIKDSAVKKKKIEKLKSYSRCSYAKVPSMKRKSKQ